MGVSLPLPPKPAGPPNLTPPPPRGVKKISVSRPLTKPLYFHHFSLIPRLFSSPISTTPENPQRTNKTQIGGTRGVPNPTPRES